MKKTPILLALARRTTRSCRPRAPTSPSIPNEVPADSFSRFAIRVPNERPDADTTKIAVQLPAGPLFVSFQPKPGWTRTSRWRSSTQPVDVDEGETVTERIATVTWEGGTIAPGEFDEFGMSAKVPAERDDARLPGGADVLERRGRPLDRRARRGCARAASHADGEGRGGRAPRRRETDRGRARPTDDDVGLDGLALAFGIAGLVAGLAALAVALVRRPKRS